MTGSSGVRAEMKRSSHLIWLKLRLCKFRFCFKRIRKSRTEYYTSLNPSSTPMTMTSANGSLFYFIFCRSIPSKQTYRFCAFFEQKLRLSVDFYAFFRSMQKNAQKIMFMSVFSTFSFFSFLSYIFFSPNLSYSRKKVVGKLF
jgi:hypothetical protein